MLKRNLSSIILLVLIITLVNQSAPVDAQYEEEYKFLFSLNNWSQISGYGNYSHTYTSQHLLKVINSTDDNITYSEMTSGGYGITVYNYSITELFSWIGPIGHHFINPNEMNHYYDLWLNEENLTEAYMNIIGVGYTTDERSAEDFTFEAYLSIFLEDEELVFTYSDEEAEIEQIIDDVNLSIEIYVEYDTSGVLHEWKEKVSVDGSKIQQEVYRFTQRVDDFSVIGVTDETNAANLLYSLTAIFALIAIVKKHSSKQI
jgi:hypothetical protein